MNIERYLQPLWLWSLHLLKYVYHFIYRALQRYSETLILRWIVDVCVVMYVLTLHYSIEVYHRRVHWMVTCNKFHLILRFHAYWKFVKSIESIGNFQKHRTSYYLYFSHLNACQLLRGKKLKFLIFVLSNRTVLYYFIIRNRMKNMLLRMWKEERKEER